MTKVVTLYRPVGKVELELIENSNWQEFPPRLPEQPIFYPVTNEEYAIQIARDWNTKFNEDKCGYVTAFEIDASYLSRFDKKIVGGGIHEEYWIPADELQEFNTNIIGPIRLLHSFGKSE